MAIITVVNQSTDAPIVGAQVFVNGVSYGVTDSHGQLNVTIVTSASVSVKDSGFVQTPAVTVNSTDSFTFSLVPVAVPTSTTFLLTIYPETASAGTNITFDNDGSPVTLPYTTGGLKVPNLTPGMQTITGDVSGYQSINVTVDTTQSNIGTIQLVALSDSGLANALQTAITTDPNTSAMLPTLTPEQKPEWVAPNTTQGTYFTMTQARMYIGGIFIDELNALQFALQDNKMPIYGYSSRFFDAMAQGKSLVQGQFTVNFISEGYLYVALKEYQRQITSDITVGSDVTAQQQARLLTLTNSLQNPDPSWTPQMIAAAKTEIQTLAASLGAASIDAAKSGIGALKRQQNNSILGLPGEDYANPLYLDVPFDIVVQYTGAGRTITRRLESCYLISNESIMDHSGTPILDSYGFIARRLR